MPSDDPAGPAGQRAAAAASWASAGQSARDAPLSRLLRRVIDVRPPEVVLLGWAWLYVLAVMCAYYVIRPIRDAMGIEGGVENLQWLFTGTLLAMLAINPAYAALVRVLPRQRFIAIAYRFFIANLLVFAVLLHFATGEPLIWLGRAFFIWVSVFNLFVVSVFWALMVDVFDSAQGKRLFGFLAAGATVGAIVGSSLTASLASGVGATWLLLASALFLQVAIVSAGRLSSLTSRLARRPAPSATPSPSPGSAPDPDPGPEPAAAGPAPARLDAPAPGYATHRAGEAPVGGSVWAGLTHTARSPYLLNISLYILLYSITSTFLYFQQAAIVRDYFPDRATRTTFFASVDLAVNAMTLCVQLFLTSRFLRVFGVGVTAAVLPFLTLLGFGALAAAPALAVLVTVQVLRRVGNFGLARPTRELFFTVVPREDKYKAKSAIDTVVYRAGDQAGSWSYALLGMLGAGPAGVALAALPISLAWLVNALWLGRRQKAMASHPASSDHTGPSRE